LRNTTDSKELNPANIYSNENYMNIKRLSQMHNFRKQLTNQFLN